MDRETNYVAVGTFVLVVLAMATVFVLWYTNSSDRREYQRYEVYFSGSVSGLQEGSTVRYLGVNVGRVARIRLDARAADRVLVLVDVDKATPVRPETVARLSMQGVTGLLFIDLAQVAEPTHAHADVPSQEYPVIHSEASDFDIFFVPSRKLITRVAGPEINGSGNGKKASPKPLRSIEGPKSLLNFWAMSRASSRCCF